MMTMPAVFDMLFFYRNGTTASKLRIGQRHAAALLIELAATHEKITSGIGADEAAFLVEEL